MKINLLEVPFCKICNTSHESVSNLTRHLKRDHSISPEEYTLVYLMDNVVPLCECGCGKPVVVRRYHYRTYFCQSRQKFYNELYDKDSDEYKEIIRKISEASTKRHAETSPYSRNPEDWKIKCSNCDEYIMYKSFGGYQNAMRYNAKNPDSCVKCKRCVNLGRIISPEIKQTMSIAAKNRNISEENNRLRSEKLSASHIHRYANMTTDDRLELSAKIREGQNKKSNEEMELWQHRKRISMRKRMKELGTENVFKPAYNIDTIPYIIDILNVRYDTEFIHAECDGGEFRLYDDLEERFYYADAYCPRLNIWVEFDEKYHNQQQDLDAYRDERVRSILNCQVLRVNFNKNLLKNCKG